MDLAARKDALPIFFLHGRKAFFLSHTKVVSPDLSFLSGDY